MRRDVHHRDRRATTALHVAPGGSPAGASSPRQLLGADHLRPDFPGRAAHVANAGYVVAREGRGRRLYESLGWREVGRISRAVDMEDAVVYWRAVP